MSARFSPHSAGFLAGGGETGTIARSLDWSATPLGPVEDWPVPLRTTASICLGSRFGLCAFWGPDLITIYNDAYAPMLGRKHPEAMGMPLREIWPEIWHQIGPMLDEVRSTGTPTWSEDQELLLERDGFPEQAYFTYSFSAIRDESGGVGGVFTAVTETTRRVVTTRRLEALTGLADRVAEARSRDEVARAAVAALSDAGQDVPFALLYLLDDDGGRLAGAHGIPAGGALAPERVATTADGPWALTGGAARDVDGLEIGTTGGARVTRATVLPVARLGAPAPAAVLVLGVNPLRPLDDDYRDFFGLIARQVSSALGGAEGFEAERARADQLAALDKAKTEFFSNVSHEFRTPLMLMLGPLTDAVNDPAADPAVQRERIAIANRGALRLLRLVNTLLDFSRLEAGRSTAAFAPVDLGRLVTETAAVFRAAAERSGLELRVDVPEGDCTIEADAEMLEKILLNLLSNAYKFTFEGAIDVRVRLDGQAAVIEVADSGVGVAPADQPRLFERFHRVEGAAGRSHEGSGIGLALVSELVEQHGGQVGVESRPGRGSTFRVELPLTQPGDVELPPARSLFADAHRAGFGEEALRWHGEQTIELAPQTDGEAELLVVDDNADLRAYLSRLLGDRYTVRTAVDGVDALERLRERPADLVLTDVMMPRMDGFGLLAKLREDPRTRRLPVIMLSARAGDEATVEGLDAGADDYLVKPFSSSELLARVHANLEVVRLRDALAAGERDRAREMEDVALALQRSLLPHELPDVLGVELAGRYVPAGLSLEIGGDFYDATQLGDGRVAIAIGDVAGHGVMAAAVMGQVRQGLRAYALEGHPPAELMSRLDRLVQESDLAMTTCLCGILDPADGTLEFSNAGHPPPLIRRTDGTVERLTGGLSHPLGVTAGLQRAHGSTVLAVGDALLLYTDGLVERRGEVIDVGIDALAARLAAASEPPSAICDGIVSSLAPGLGDDVAILALERTPMAEGELTVVMPAKPTRLAELRRRLGAWLAAQGAGRGEVSDIVLAVHEAAMNAVEHAYGPGDAELTVLATRRGSTIEVVVSDAGRWREPRDPLRGRGQGIMSALMDEVMLEKSPRGSTVRLRRRLEGSG